MLLRRVLQVTVKMRSSGLNLQHFNFCIECNLFDSQNNNNYEVFVLCLLLMLLLLLDIIKTEKHLLYY